jgi:DnaD/phage-associated family protein
MALRGQPYFPLYVQDFMTNDKLNECSAESTGVYIRLMCIMHKSDNYGTIELKAKHKQTESKYKNFAIRLQRHMPFSEDVIERSLKELVEEGVLTLDGDTLFQKRMVMDDELSDKRASAGTKGAKDKQNKNFATDFATAKVVANAEYENEYENEIIKKIENESFSDCAKFLEQEFCNIVSPSICENLFSAVEEFGADVVKLAITESVAQEKRSWKYAEAILNNWRGMNVKTLEQAKKAIADFQLSKAKRQRGSPNALEEEAVSWTE